MGVIMRTAGIQRNKSEIKRDFEYLMRLWEDVREKTLVSSAPNLVYEEGDLVKRAIRDLYTREVEEIWVEGTETYQSAKKQMRMMMPSHAKRVQPYKELSMPMFHRYQVENQIEAMHNPVVQLKSGGYLVINPTEALVAIDVNSGRATKERNIEETATKTNLEAASEIAYQLKLRDLAGLIVIDFIDMEERANQRSVERRFKESVKADRAKIQIGRISNFGLLEMSRQRMRPSLVENSTQPCPHCSGTGNVRSTESMTLHALRLIEEEGTRMRSSEVSITLPNHIALYLLNEKRDALDAMESKYSFRIRILGDDSISATEIQLERVKTRKLVGEKKIENEILPISEENDSQNDPARKKRSRRRRRKKSEPENLSEPASSVTEEEVSVEATPGLSDEGSPEQGPVRKRRGRRGGKRRPPRDKERQAASADAVGSPQQEVHEHLPEKPEAAKDVAAVEEVKADTESRKVQSTKTNKSNDKKQGIEEIEPKTGSNPAPKKGWWQRILD
jgi:ribonuclease E